jgi:hypothetical protein
VLSSGLYYELPGSTRLATGWQLQLYAPVVAMAKRPHIKKT